MINILLEGHNLTHDWIYAELKKYIKPYHKIVVVPFSFRERDAADCHEWNKLYGKRGYITSGITKSFGYYGVDEKNIVVVDYFNDTKERAANKIRWADIVYFPGGLPHKITERSEELGIYKLLADFDGIVMGNSAGALVQLENYHLSPDRDYPEFTYYKGFSYLKNFYLEVHYTESEVQRDSIKRVLQEKKKPVYAMSIMAGGIIVNNGEITTFGRVERFDF